MNVDQHTPSLEFVTPEPASSPFPRTKPLYADIKFAPGVRGDSWVSAWDDGRRHCTFDIEVRGKSVNGPNDRAAVLESMADAVAKIEAALPVMQAMLEAERAKLGDA